jgi:hypothetical protein
MFATRWPTEPPGTIPRVNRLDSVPTQGRLAALSEHLGREPHLQAQLQRAGGRRHQPSDVAALEPDRVAVQVVPDDLRLTAGGDRVEDRRVRNRLE